MNRQFLSGTKTIFIGLLLMLLFSTHFMLVAQVNSVKTETAEQVQQRLQWFRDARFGMFIHWGPVSLKGTEIGWSRGKQVPVKVYDNLYKQFNPIKFDADEWVKIAKTTGMKYIVFTSKHHDGFCMWDTKTTPYNIMNTPFKRDVVKELAKACEKQGIIFCTYYSILDWYHPDYNISSHGGPGYSLPEGCAPNMDRYESYMKMHLKELIQNYGPIGILWFDGEWEEPWTHERGESLYYYVRDLQTNIIINNRVDKGREGMKGTTKADQVYVGDYDTPEQEVGTFQTDRPWETCMTICQQWAWKPKDKLKSLKECIHILVQSAGGDGNLLLNVGPQPDGTIEARQVERLKEIGAWMEKYGQSIYKTRGGPFKPADWGVSTQIENKIYIHVLDWPRGKVVLPRIPQKIKSSTVLTGGVATVSQNAESIEIDVPKNHRDLIDTIISLVLE